MLGNIFEWTNTAATRITQKKFERDTLDVHNKKIIKGGSFATSGHEIDFDLAKDVDANNLHNIGLRIAISC